MSLCVGLPIFWHCLLTCQGSSHQSPVTSLPAFLHIYIYIDSNAMYRALGATEVHFADLFALVGRGLRPFSRLFRRCKAGAPKERHSTLL